MAWLGMSDQEFEYWLSSYADAFYMVGQDAKLYQAESLNRDEYLDIQVNYAEGVDIGILFIDNPKPILKSNNWIIEDEDLPYVCYMVTKDRNQEKVIISEGMRVVIPSLRGVVTERQFIVTHVKGVSIDPLLWVCSMAPQRVRTSAEKPSPRQTQHDFNRSDVGRDYIKNDKN